MIKKIKKSIECAVVNTSSRLGEVFTNLFYKNIDFDEAEDQVKEIYKQTQDKSNFEALLQDAHLDGYNFQYKEEVPDQFTNTLPSISANNTDLFKYRDTAKNKIQGEFSRNVFKYLFVNRSKTFTGNPYITSKRQFNNGAQELKNFLCQELANLLKIESLQGKQFFSESGSVENNYEQLMNSAEVSNFVSKYKDSLLDNPIGQPYNFHIFSTLYAIQNFDSMLESELGNLVSIDPQNKGKLSNNNYTRMDDVNSTEYWASDSYEDKGIKEYTSNLTKFILRQIPKVNRVHGQLVSVEGEYLNENELYVLSGLLKQAEYEYFLLHPDSPVLFSENTTKAFRTLLNAELPVFQNAKQQLLDSIKSFLYTGTTQEHAIKDLYTLEQISKNPNTLDIESLLASEVNQSYAPNYVEFNNEGIPEIKNYNGAYARTSSLGQNLGDFLFQQWQSKRKTIKKDFKAPRSINSNDKLIQTVAKNALGLDPDAHSQFIDNNISEVTKLMEELSKLTHEGYIFDKAKELLKKDDIPGLYQLAQRVAKQSLLRGNKILSKSFKNDYFKLISERVVTQFDSYADSTLPVYRLDSAITKDTWFLKQYRDSQKSSGQNFLVDNPLVFSKYNETAGGEDINTFYRAATSYLVDLGTDNNTGVNQLTVQDQKVISILSNLFYLSENGDSAFDLFSFQPVCYSDKTSIGQKVVNLQTKIQTLGKRSGTTTLKEFLDFENPEASIDKIRKYDFYYRQNNTINLVNDVLKKWGILLNDPELSAIEFDFSKTSNTEKKSAIESQLKQIEYLNSKIAKLKADDLYVLCRQHPEIELIDQLDYAKGKGGLSFNRALKYDLQSVIDFKTFKSLQDQSWEKFRSSEDYERMIQAFSGALLNAKKDSKLYQILVRSNPNDPDFFLSKVWNSESRKYEIKTTNKTHDIIKMLQSMENFLSYSYIDAVSKNYYLDKPKGSIADDFQDRARRIDSMSKRMVLYPATIQSFAQGLFNGVSHDIKVACIEDPAEQVWNTTGATHDQDIFDGSGFVNSWEAMMESNSLPGHGIKGSIKSLGTSTIGQNSTLFKWAGYPLNNAKLRNSQGNKFQLLTLFKKMNSIPFDYDITKSWSNLNLTRPQDLIHKNLFYSNGFQYFRIENVLPTPTPGLYNLVVKEVDKTGKVVDPDPIQQPTYYVNTLYDLWDMLGGINSMEIIDGELQPSEASMEATFQYIIHCGEKTGEGLDQDSLYQPLRNKFINIAVNHSALKRGAANINPANRAWDSSSPLNTFTCNTSCFGIQLDANHHSDMAEVREMSQTISTLAALGYTTNLAEEAYNAIGKLVQVNIDKLKFKLTQIEKGNLDKSIELISKKIIDLLSKDNKINSIDTFIDAFTTEMDTVLLPISDRKFYSTFVKEIISDLNKSSIRRKYAGLGGVLNPSSNIMQLYESGGKSYLWGDLLINARRFFEQNPVMKDNLIHNWTEFNNGVEIPRDQDIVDYYLAITANGYNESEPANITINNFRANNGTPINSIQDLNNIKILDTIKYKTPTDSTYQTLVLDSKENMGIYRDLINQYWNTYTGSFAPGFELLKVINAPHDLRPQTISWIKSENVDGNILQKPENIYTTQLSELYSVLNSDMQENIDIDTILADLAEEGEANKESCKI